MHDVDFALWCFGAPQAVTIAGTRHHFAAQWQYADAPSLLEIEGGWIPVEGFGFHMRYRVVFEEAVAEFYHADRHPLCVTTQGGTRVIPLAKESAYEAEVRHMLRAVRDGTELRATLEQAARATEWIEQESALLKR